MSPLVDSDVPVEGGNRRLNRLVAITVVLLAMFPGLGRIKDDNIVQAMQQTKADAVDSWNEYQDTKIKLKIDEASAATLALFAETPRNRVAIAAQASAIAGRMAKYRSEIPTLKVQARRHEARYEVLNVTDDQFDAADALISIAVSAAAVASLAETIGMLVFAWVIGGVGVAMTFAAFCHWALHPAFLAQLLG